MTAAPREGEVVGSVAGAAVQGLLLHTDHEPTSPTEWEQWHRVTRKAITEHYATAHAEKATPDGTASSLVLPAPDNRRPQRPSTALRLTRPPGPCLSRVPRRVARTVLRAPAQQCAGATRLSRVWNQ